MPTGRKKSIRVETNLEAAIHQTVQVLLLRIAHLKLQQMHPPMLLIRILQVKVQVIVVEVKILVIILEQVRQMKEKLQTIPQVLRQMPAEPRKQETKEKVLAKRARIMETLKVAIILKVQSLEEVKKRRKTRIMIPVKMQMARTQVLTKKRKIDTFKTL